MLPESPQSIYAARMQRVSQDRDIAQRQWSLLGNVRLVAALVIIVGLWQFWQNGGQVWFAILAVGAIAFVILAFRQRSAREERDGYEALHVVNERALTRFQHDWDALPAPPDANVDRNHPYAYDLNIVGWASIAQRIGTPATRHGWRSLYSSLLDGRVDGDLSHRQHAVAELAGKIDLRQAVEAAAVETEEIPDPAPLLAWVRLGSWLRHRAWLRWAAVTGPLIVVIFAVLVILGILPWVILLIPITINTLIFLAAGSDAAGDVRQIGPMRKAAVSYHAIMASISADSPETPLLRDLDERLTGASDALQRLTRIVNFAIPPGSMLYFPMQMLLMWDVNLLGQLENWRDQHGADVHNWLEAMGEWEALAALSVLTHDHPAWTLPGIDMEAEGIIAVSLAHPLLAPEVAVSNDVEITPRGHFLFVTGSNMSGKSTLLRAIGVNVILAQAGSSVCAQSLIMPPLQVSCCMTVEDSLAHGVSFFMAELRRLKSVIDRVRESGSRTPLYLLDEILQGTNTAERQIASRYVLHQLTRLPAIGAVSSHDLELIDDTELEEVAIAVHFAEQFTRENDEPQMTFDYHSRPGLATSSNAIRLMELIGFEIPE